MAQSFTPDDLHNFDFSRSLEWIETNGLGGYASDTVAGAHSRRYHGLLVAATHPPVGRMVLVSKFEETIVLQDKRFNLSSNQYPGVIHPEGHRHLVNFERLFFPEFYFKAGEVQIKKTVAAIHGENTTIILYEVLNAPEKFTFELLPLYSSRDFHALSKNNDRIGQQYLFGDGIFQTLNYHGCPEFFLAVPGAQFIEQKNWYYNYEYSEELARGLDFMEDLFTHGKFQIELKKGSKIGVIISTENPAGRNAFKLFDKEKNRREKIVHEFQDNEVLRRLVLAADQFIVKRGKLGTIIAGYHWFSDWGRDTMIALPGICLVTKRIDDAKNILKAFAGSVSEGMIPNRFPDYGEAPEYNTVDATLWFFQAVFRYYKATSDITFIKKLLPILKEIIHWHYKGTRYNIKVDKDELLSAGQPGVQLTWMDAKVGDWVVTPRYGKAVEINALWYNALRIMEYFSRQTGVADDAISFRQKAEKVLDSFNVLFWNERQQCLYDYIDGDYFDDDLRPNQIYAISLPFQLLTKEKAEKVFAVIKNDLFTPVGLRSLSPFNKDYKTTCNGSVSSRDGAYHEGTIWSFLMGPYIDALMHVTDGKAKTEAAEILKNFLPHLDRAGVGSISEIFDSEPPHTPRGCIAQAWSVGEILRVAVEYDLLK